MREFSKVYPQFWTGRTGREIRRLGRDCQVVALYLITAPTANAIGLYYLPLAVMAHETGLSEEEARRSLGRLIETGFCAYDELSETVFVFNMARFQIGKELKPTDKQVIWIKRLFQAAKDSPFFRQFFGLYGDAYQLVDLGFSKPLGSPIEDPSKPLRSIETEIETESEIKTETKTEHRDGKGDTRENHDSARVTADDRRRDVDLDPITARTQQVILDRRAKLSRRTGS